MTTQSLHTLIHYLRRSLPPPGDRSLSDAELLRRWNGRQDAAAFELLLWRHGPMVLSICRRLLRQNADAEDAFQATFLVLMRKAGSIRRGETLAAWLHRVACRIAVRARSQSTKLNRREQPLSDLLIGQNNDEQAAHELQALLDEEIDRLPLNYRRAVILCCLQGKSQEEVARLLACPRGTVSSWLTRGRERLRQRLLRRGIIVSSAGVSAALAIEASSAGLSPLVESLVHAAVGGTSTELLSSSALVLAERMLRAMIMTKMKVVVAVFLVFTALAAGFGTMSHATSATDPPATLEEKETTKKTNQANKSLPLSELEEIQHSSKTKKKYPSENHYSVTLTNYKPPVWNALISWGKAAQGLQAGIAIRPGDSATCEIGQSVTFVVYLHNVSDKEIQLSHLETLFEEQLLPVVQDFEGKRLKVESRPLISQASSAVHRTLKPGQQITLGYPWLRLCPLDWKGSLVGPICFAAPGRYKVGYTSLPLQLNGDKADVSGPGTGQVDLVIRETEATKEAHSQKAESDLSKLSREITPVRVGVENLSNEPKLIYCSNRTFAIPFRLRPESNKQITTLLLLVSQDRGESWILVDQIKAEAEKFRFNAPRDGEYWFAVQEVANFLQGRVVGTETQGLKPALKVCVDTTLPVAELVVSQKKPDEFLLSWTANDLNLEEKPITLEWAEKKEGPWHPIGSGPLPNDGIKYSLKIPTHASPYVYIRLRVRDKAGNEASTIACM